MIAEFAQAFNENPEYFIVAIGLIIIIFGFSTVSSYVIKRRIGAASWCGKLEHRSGRLLGLMLAITSFIVYFKEGFTFTFYAVCACFLMWCVYLVAHTIEKLLYPNNFRF